MDKRPSKITIDDENNSSSIFLPVFAIVALGLFLTLCWYAYTYYVDQQKKEGVYYIKADKSPLKVTPDNPGGLVVENQDKQIFNAMVGDAENLDGKINTVEGEAPASSEDIAKAVQDDFAEDGISSNTKTEPKDKELQDTKTNMKIELPGDSNKEAPEAGDSENKAPEKIAMSPQEKQKKAEQPAVIAGVAAKDKNDQKEEAVKIKPDEKSIMVTKEKDESTGKNKTIVTLKEESKPSMPAPKSMNSKAAASSAPASGGKGFFVQISSHRTMEDLEGGWKRFLSKHSTISTGSSRNITEATVNGVKFYRLSFGPYASRQSAIDKCKALKSKGQDCLVQAY